MSQPQTMIIEFGAGGHRPVNILHLLRHWQQWQCQGKLWVVVSPRFVARHGEFIHEAAQVHNVELVSMSDTEVAGLERKQSLVQRAFYEWRLLNQYLKQTGADQCMSMYIDLLLLPLAFRLKAQRQVSGIYFRPTFHYENFQFASATRADKVRAMRQRFQVGLALRNPSLQYLFSFDPFAAEYLQRQECKPKPVHLPDPVTINPTLPGSNADDLRQQLGIEAQRTVFLLFGSLDRRKGIFQILEAIRLLDTDTAKMVCLLIVGSVAKDIEAELAGAVQSLQHSQPAQIISYNKYVEQSLTPQFFQLADVVLTPYIRHVGMSGILLQAAAAGKPVISSNYGLLGEIVYRYQLGQLIDSENPQKLAEALMMSTNKGSKAADTLLFDPVRAEQIVSENSDNRFAYTVLSKLGHIQHPREQ